MYKYLIFLFWLISALALNFTKNTELSIYTILVAILCAIIDNTEKRK